MSEPVYCSWEGYELTVILICVGRMSIIFPVVLCECESWALTLREERRLSLFENRVLRRIFWRRRNEVTGEWRKLHNEELKNSELLIMPANSIWDLIRGF